VSALSDCGVLAVAHESLRLITERFPHLTRMLWLTTLVDGAINRRWLMAMGRLSAAERLAHLISELAVRLEVVGLLKDHSFELPMTQAELADVLGLSAVHVNRVVQTLRQEALISWPGRTLTILDRERLAEYGEFDPVYLHLHEEPR
jgi:CRP-like cAMP-binding protein